MKITTYNINNVKRRLPNSLTGWGTPEGPPRNIANPDGL
jgi:hypothetical protein